METAIQNRIKVIGVGGAGSNAISHLYRQQIEGVSLLACNTAASSLSTIPVADKLLVGDYCNSVRDDQGSMNPALLDFMQDVKALLSDGTEMLFIVAGLGGSTSSTTAPIIAQIAKKLGILTIGIGITPFSSETDLKKQTAMVGLQKLRESLDSMIVLSNENLRDQYGNLATDEAFLKVDQLIAQTVKAVAKILTVETEIFVDIEDMNTVLADAGTAVIGSSIKSGKNRAMEAIREALNPPLYLNGNIKGAHIVLLSIMGGEAAELEMEELTEITQYLQQQSGLETEIIFGHGIDKSLDDKIRVTVIAAGFSDN